MPCIKSILSSCICILCFTTLSAQVSLQKDKTVSNVNDQRVNQQKLCSVRQEFKESVLFKYVSDLHYNAHLTISTLSTISISFSDCLPPPAEDSTVSEKLESHLQKNLFMLVPYKYFLDLTYCWNPHFYKKYESFFSNNSFFKY